MIAETEQVFKNLGAVLEAADKSFDDVVRAGVFSHQHGDFAAMNGVYAKQFSQPSRRERPSCGCGLPLGASVEIDLVVKG